MKHQVVHALQKYVLNPPIKLLFAMGVITSLSSETRHKETISGCPNFGQEAGKATVCYCSLSILFAEFTLQCQDAAQSAIIPNTRTLLSRYFETEPGPPRDGFKCPGRL